jgi:hypothetical protein
MRRESVVVLLDVNGVLNPRMVAGRLQLDEARAVLVRELAALGRVVWATTWPPPFTAQLEGAVGMPGDTRAIDFSVPDDRQGDYAGETGKLPKVRRWLGENAGADGPEAGAVVWIDDHLGADARAWAAEQQRPVLLVQPHAFEGLTAEQVAEVRRFLG